MSQRRKMKKLGRQKPKKSNRAKLVDKLDDLVSIIIRGRDQKCVVCGSTDKLTNGHIFSRGSYSTRWDITEDGNCHTQCWGCNYKHVRDQYPYFNWYIKKFGQVKFDALRRRFKETRPYKDYELEEIYEELLK